MIHLFANKISKTPICGQLFGIPTSLVLRQGEAFVLGPKLCAKNNLHSSPQYCRAHKQGGNIPSHLPVRSIVPVGVQDSCPCHYIQGWKRATSGLKELKNSIQLNRLLSSLCKRFFLLYSIYLQHHNFHLYFGLKNFPRGTPTFSIFKIIFQSGMYI